MSIYERIAVIRNGKDVARLIPFNPLDGTYDFKINLLDNAYDIKIYQQLSYEPIIGNVIDPQDWEITYHKSCGAKPPIIHLKHKPVENPKDFYDKDHPEYISLPLIRLQEPNINSRFPIPFLKIEIPHLAVNKSYKKKNGHKTLDIGEQNVVELYLANTDFNSSEFERCWPCISFMYLISPFETFALNSIDKYPQKLIDFLPHDEEPRTACKDFLMNDEIQIVANIFYDKNVDDTKEKITLTFIENQLSTSIAANIMIAYPKANNTTHTYDALYARCANENDLKSEDMIFTNNPLPLWKTGGDTHFNIQSPAVSAFERDILRNRYTSNEKRILRDEFLQYRRELLRAIKNAAGYGACHL